MAHLLNQEISFVSEGDGGFVPKILQNSSDQELLSRFLVSHDDEAFKELVARHSPMVMGVCRRILRNSHDADDACQCVFLVLAQKASDLKDRDSIGSWIYRVAVNAALQSKRRISARVEREEFWEDEMHDTSQNDEGRQSQLWAEIRPLIDEELNRLPEKHRAPIVLCYLKGFTYEEACKELGVSFKALQMRLERTRGLLKDRFERRGIVLSSALLFTLLMRNASAAAPDILVNKIVKAAICISTEKTAGSALISVKTAKLFEDVVQSMFMQKLRIAGAIVFLVIGLGMIGVEMNGGIGAEHSLVEKTQEPMISSVSATPQTDLQSSSSKLRMVSKVEPEDSGTSRQIASEGGFNAVKQSADLSEQKPVTEGESGAVPVLAKIEDKQKLIEAEPGMTPKVQTKRPGFVMKSQDGRASFSWGSSTRNYNREKLLHAAIVNGDREKVKELIKNGANVGLLGKEDTEKLQELLKEEAGSNAIE